MPRSCSHGYHDAPYCCHSTGKSCCLAKLSTNEVVVMTGCPCMVALAGFTTVCAACIAESAEVVIVAVYSGHRWLMVCLQRSSMRPHFFPLHAVIAVAQHNTLNKQHGACRWFDRAVHLLNTEKRLACQPFAFSSLRSLHMMNSLQHLVKAHIKHMAHGHGS